MEHPAMNPAAPHHLPGFVAGPGQSDWLMTVMLVFLLVAVISVGLVYLKLHALPEHMAHRTNKVQLQFVAVLALLALVTHNHVFWIAGLLLAMVDLPDFSTPLNSVALSLERMSGRDRAPGPASRWNDLLSDDLSDLPAAPPPADPKGPEA
ncbi:hypothetical protein [Amaricoccus sp.]|uniref:hypothetical protein n=1 Tax=Amaricoccus sp. TaxID=1872485 RepID=UPI001B68AF27|nr:hypothetical protein [Amaricoccus sp.]MBP7000686.1 hypothetical protein [Amaricoccus sp.]